MDRITINLLLDFDLTIYLCVHCIALQAYSDWLYVVPWGLYKALIWTKEKFNSPVMLIGENGIHIYICTACSSIILSVTQINDLVSSSVQELTSLEMRPCRSLCTTSSG